VVRCLSWPLYGAPLALTDLRGWLDLARLMLSAMAGLLVVALLVAAWLGKHELLGIRSTATLVGFSLATEVVIGALILACGYSVVLQVAHVTMAAALWASLVVLVVLVGLDSPVVTGSRHALHE
jgi:heme A synthase